MPHRSLGQMLGFETSSTILPYKRRVSSSSFHRPSGMACISFKGSLAEHYPPSSVYLVDVLNNQVPPPDPIFPVIALPTHISRGIPHARINPSGRAANASQKVAAVDQDEAKGAAPTELDNLKEATLMVEAGSEEAHELFESLEGKVIRIAKLLNRSQGAVAQGISMALWKDRQGKFFPVRACFQCSI